MSLCFKHVLRIVRGEVKSKSWKGVNLKYQTEDLSKLIKMPKSSKFALCAHATYSTQCQLCTRHYEVHNYERSAIILEATLSSGTTHPSVER